MNKGPQNDEGSTSTFNSINLEKIMTKTQNQPIDENVKDLVCPDCRAELTRRRTRNPDACEMLCGGCGQIFDVCDFETVEKLKQT